MNIDAIGRNDLNGLEASLASGRRSEAEIARLRADQGAGDSKAASERFETYFATQLVKEMRSGLQSGFFGEEAGSDTYSSWFDDFVGQSLAKSGAFDLSRLIEGQRAFAAAPGQSAASEAVGQAENQQTGSEPVGPVEDKP